MEPTKAIEILDLFVQHLPPGFNDDLRDALKLGIEALKEKLSREEEVRQ